MAYNRTVTRNGERQAREAMKGNMDLRASEFQPESTPTGTITKEALENALQECRGVNGGAGSKSKPNPSLVLASLYHSAFFFFFNNFFLTAF